MVAARPDEEWTIATLKEYFERRAEAQDRAVATALTAAKEAVAAAMAAAEKAVTKAETATEKRLEGMNEFRQTLTDQQATFVRQDVADARFKGIESQIGTVVTALNDNKSRGAGRNDIYLIAIAVIAIALSALALLKPH